MKDKLVYILSVGVAFYIGTKYQYVKKIDNIKVGKLIVEFQDKVKKCEPVKCEPVEKEGFTCGTPVPTEDDEISKVLKPEETEEKEPIQKKEAYEIEEEIEACYNKYIKELEEELIGKWDYVKKMTECKKTELKYQNCFYEEEEYKKNCERKAVRKSDTYFNELLDIVYADTPEEIEEKRIKKEEEREEQKNIIKEALEEVNYENN